MDTTKFQSVSIAKVMNDLTYYRYNPMGIQRVILDLLDEVSNGDIDIVDATNPFVFQLEASSVNTALANSESMVNLRKQYPVLAQTEEDVYLHMSDDDFIDRFAVASETSFKLVMSYAGLVDYMVYDPIEKCKKAIIPRDTEFRADGIPFTMQYPIVIRWYDNSILEISYDTTYSSPLQILHTNILDYFLFRDSQQSDWISIDIPVRQFQIATTYDTLQKSIAYTKTIPFTDKYYYCRVYYQNTNKWVEMPVTHTDQVFDPFKPTAVLKVFSDHLNVFIPTIYTSSGMISGQIRIDLYTTLGAVNIIMANYSYDSFTTKLRAIDERRDMSSYAQVLSNITYYSINKQVVSGGSNGIDFATLRERVIFNSVGIKQLPITNVEISAYVENQGFELVRNIDVITNRIFLASRPIPKPLEPKLITPANTGISPVTLTKDMIVDLPYVVSNGDRITILTDNIYENINGIVRFLSRTELAALTAASPMDIVNNVNSHQYLYSPYYYVIDSSLKELEVRTYNLNYPVSSSLSFLAQNQTLLLIMNTATYTLSKIADGYRVTVTTKSASYYKELKDSQVSAQLGYYAYNEQTMSHIQGVLQGKDANGERIFTFDLKTNYDIDRNHTLAIVNGHSGVNGSVTTWVPLTFTGHIFYTTTSLTDVYKPSELDHMLNPILLPASSAAITHETIELKLGDSLKNLWSRSRTYAFGSAYETHQVDVPLMYEKDIYKLDPKTSSIVSIVDGEIAYTVEHHIGDPVLDVNGNPVMKYIKGSVKLDDKGSPIPLMTGASAIELDMLFIDAKYKLATDTAFVKYRSELANIISSWVTVDLAAIQNRLLEQTKIFLYSKTSLGMVKVLVNDGEELYISSEQSFKVELYVKDNVYIDKAVRDLLSLNTVKIIDQYVRMSIVNITDVTVALKASYGETVTAVNVTGLGGDKNYSIISVLDEHNKLCLKKLLVLQKDGSTVVSEDISVSFFNVERPITKI